MIIIFSIFKVDILTRILLHMIPHPQEFMNRENVTSFLTFANFLISLELLRFEWEKNQLVPNLLLSKKF